MRVVLQTPSSVSASDLPPEIVPGAPFTVGKGAAQETFVLEVSPRADLAVVEGGTCHAIDQWFVLRKVE